jgi:hypothetical protein
MLRILRIICTPLVLGRGRSMGAAPFESFLGRTMKNVKSQRASTARKMRFTDQFKAGAVKRVTEEGQLNCLPSSKRDTPNIMPLACGPRSIWISTAVRTSQGV